MLVGLIYSRRDGIAIAYAARERERKRRVEADKAAAMALVVETVHPGNLGALPPSPQVLLAKAWQLGLGVFV